MAGQAGWYRAPGEEGLLRWWNGSIWTDHRQPDPAAIGKPEALPPVEDPDPMAEYERQFDVPSLPDSALDRPSYNFDALTLDSSPVTTSTDPEVSPAQPQYRPQAALNPTPVIPVPTPEFAGTAASLPRSLGPIALGPAATPVVDKPGSEFDLMYDDVAALAATPTVDAAPTPLAQPASVAAPLEAGTAPNRKAVLGAARIMAAAILIIVLGVAAMLILSFQSSAGAGEVETNAIVTSLGARTSDSCTPVARFAVAGKSFTANSSAAISPCPIGLGESVDVVYSAANPASAARIEVGSSAAQYLWVVPILGGLIFVGGLIAFIIRAGSILGGIALLRDGRKRTKTAVTEP